MKSHRRAFVGLVSGALVLGGGLAATPPAIASGPDGIFVFAGDTFELSALSSTTMLDSEELQILPFSGSPGSYVVRNYDAAADDLGRPILASRGGCVPATGITAQLVCTFSTPPPQVFVNFSSVLSGMTLVMMEGTTLPLRYIGGEGRDYVQGGTGNDTIDGYGGNDSLFGGPGNDLIDGWAGDDYVEGEQGSDDMRGGSGSNSLDAADNTADIRVDCGGVPAFLDFDKGLDKPTNCGEDPTPIPPSPVEPTDPPAPGQGEGTIDGAPTTVEVTRESPNDDTVVVNTTPTGPTLNTGLLWLGPTAPEPTFPPNALFFPVDFTPLRPNTFVNVSIWPVPTPPGPIPLSRSARSAPVESVEIRVNAQGIAKGNVPVPQGQEPGNFVMQINGVTASGGQMSINVGVVLAEKTPEPDPGPDESIAIASAKRGKAKKISTITVRGTTTGLAGKTVTARYKLDRAKKWVMGASTTVGADGTYVLRVTTTKKVRIQVVSGAIRSPGVVVAAAKR